MPYLKTEERIVIRGISFWPSQDLEANNELDDDCKTHLRSLFSMFYLKNDGRIEQMTYTHFHLKPNHQKPSELIMRLREARIFIGFFYSSPHFPGGDPFLLHEHADLYLFSSAHVPKFLLGKENEVDKSSHDDKSLPDHVEGYEGILNWHSQLWVASGSRIYPSLPDMWLNKTQDISSDLKLIEYKSYLWPMLSFLNSQDIANEETQLRVFTAMEWYNRSCSGHISDDVSLIHLATAFESLLNPPQGPDLTVRLKESLTLLLGNIPRLDSWIEQFYNARSKILHNGYWPYLGFYATDSDAYKLIIKRKQEGIVYRSLSAYGRRIFRLCLQIVLAGTLSTEASGLASLFFHNQERLQSICKILNSNDIDPNEKLRQASQSILDLHEYWLESEDLTDIKSVIGTGVLLIKTFLETKPLLPGEIEKDLLDIVNRQSELSEYEQLRLFEALAKSLSSWKNGNISYGTVAPRDPLEILQLFVKFASMPNFLLRVWPISK
jgi:hypothetical protein